MAALPFPHPDLCTGRALLQRTREAPVERLRTHVEALDRVLAGGLPRGRLVELLGRRSSGRFSMLCQVLAVATRRGESAALVDLGDGFDPRLGEKAGIRLERLLWARPTHLRQALSGSQMLVAAGFHLVALDLGDPPVPGGRGPEAAWVRLDREARDRGTALLVSSPYRASGTAARSIVRLERARGVWLGEGDAPRLLDGLSTRVSLEKDAAAARGAAFRSPFAA